MEDEAVVFECAACGAAVTGALRRLPSVPEPPHYAWWDAVEPGPSPSTVPLGRWAIEPEPYGPPLVPAGSPQAAFPRHQEVRYDEHGHPLVSQGPRGTVVVNPDDARGLTLRHVSAACCGATPDGGPNQLCACGAPVATLSSDCCLPYELRLAPDRVRAARPPGRAG